MKTIFPSAHDSVLMQTFNSISLSSYIMYFRLHSHQSVTVCRDDVVRFRHRNYEVVLDWQQFANFTDLVPQLHRFKSMRWFPLTNNIWLYYKDGQVCLQGEHTFFQFYPSSWKNYKRHAHRQIASFLLHDERQQHERARDQHDANNARRQLHQPRRFTSTQQNDKQTLSWPTRNAFATNEQQQQERSTFSTREDTNPRSIERGDGTDYEERMSVESAPSEAQFSSEPHDGDESGSERDYESDTSFEEYHIE